MFITHSVAVGRTCVTKGGRRLELALSNNAVEEGATGKDLVGDAEQLLGHKSRLRGTFNFFNSIFGYALADAHPSIRKVEGCVLAF